MSHLKNEVQLYLANPSSDTPPKILLQHILYRTALNSQEISQIKEDICDHLPVL
jgi:hypothetical protein